MSIQDAYSYGASSDSYLIGGYSYQCVCVLHAILLPSGYLTLSTIAPYTLKQNFNGKIGAAVYRVNGHNIKDWIWHLGECIDVKLFAIK
jgi:hypothetical protein